MEQMDSYAVPRVLTQQLQKNDYLATVRIKQTQYIIRAYLPTHSERARVENYIASVFKQSFAADLQDFLPLLITFENTAGEIFAALGMRFADQQILFAEQYSHKDIDSVVLEKFNFLDTREHIVEIGSLASTESGYARYLFLAMTKILTNWRYQWLTFTAIPAVVNVFKKLRLNPIELCSATIKDLVHTNTNWGTYYDKNPKVMIGDVFNANNYIEQINGYSNMEFAKVS